MGISTTIPLKKLFYSNNLLLLGFFPGMQPKRSFPLLSFTPLHLNKSLARESILNEDIFSLNTSVTHKQEFTELKILVLTLIFARRTEISISDNKKLTSVVTKNIFLQ